MNKYNYNLNKENIFMLILKFNNRYIYCLILDLFKMYYIKVI